MINYNPPSHLIIGMHYADPPAPTANESTDEVLGAIRGNLPGLMEAYNQQVLPQSRTELEAAKEISPEYNQLMADLYKQFAPELARTGSEIDRETRLASAATDVDVLKGSGGDLARAYSEIDRELNPEYYSVRENSASRLNELLGESLDRPDIAAERAIAQEEARTGNDIAPSATNTIAAAMDFGDAREQRKNNLSNIISQATSFMGPASNQQFNPATTILNRPTSNTGQTQFAGVNKPSSQAYQSGGDLMNNVSSFQNNAMGINANRRDVMDRVTQGVDSVGGFIGNM
jgi:hypothetical protein